MLHGVSYHTFCFTIDASAPVSWRNVKRMSEQNSTIKVKIEVSGEILTSWILLRLSSILAMVFPLAHTSSSFLYFLVSSHCSSNSSLHCKLKIRGQLISLSASTAGTQCFNAHLCVRYTDNSVLLHGAVTLLRIRFKTDKRQEELTSTRSVISEERMKHGMTGHSKSSRKKQQVTHIMMVEGSFSLRFSTPWYRSCPTALVTSRVLCRRVWLCILIIIYTKNENASETTWVLLFWA